MNTEKINEGIATLKHYVEGYVSGQEAERALREIRSNIDDVNASENCSRFESALKEERSGRRTVENARYFMRCAIAGIEMAYRRRIKAEEN